MDGKLKNKSHLTAIKRKTISAPLRVLLNKGLLKGRILDFGCGRGFDTSELKSMGYDADGYDSYFEPYLPHKKYDTIICIYVLNTLEDNDMNDAISEVKGFLENGGHAYFAVRRDLVNEGFTARGTYQHNVILNEKDGYRSISRNSTFEIYEYTNEDSK